MPWPIVPKPMKPSLVMLPHPRSLLSNGINQQTPRDLLNP